MIFTKSKDKYILWPPYFDSSKTRKDGRRIPRSLAIENPQVQEIYEASLRLGLNPTEEESSRYPRFFWERAGKVLVDKKYRKSALILNIAKEMRSFREKTKNLRQ